MSSREILVVSSPHAGHIFPATELCNQLAARGVTVTVFYPPPSPPLNLHPLVKPIEIPLADCTNFHKRQELDDALVALVNAYFNGRDPLCAIVDQLIDCVIDPLLAFKAPVVLFSTSSASSSALALALALEGVSRDDLAGGRTVPLGGGIPEEMALTSSMLGGLLDSPPLRRRGMAAMLFSTCDEIERPFLDYLAGELKMPVWGVGPLLPARFKDGEVRSTRDSSVSEGEVTEWLDSKPRGSVIYVSFGTLFRPIDQELTELAYGLLDSTRPFIWFINPNAKRITPTGQKIEKANGAEQECCSYAAVAAAAGGSRGLIIHGWAPQLSILSHPSTAGFVSHCGWNSTLEGIRCGIPILTWPVIGDQHTNAKLVTSVLKVGIPLGGDNKEVKRGDVARGIERLLADKEIGERATSMKSIFAGGFPASSSASIDLFLNYISTNTNTN